MTLTSAKDDFMSTLHAVPGITGKLLYLAELRNEKGEYEHWGYAKIHGQQLAAESMTVAHRIIFTQLLRTKVSDLNSDLEKGSLSALEKIRRLRSAKKYAIPPGTGRAPELHFTAVLEMLSVLFSAQRLSNHPTA